MYADAVKQGFFRASPQSVRGMWTVIGLIAVVAAGIGLTYLLARYTHAGLVGIGVVLVGLVLLAVAHRMPARTAKGRAALTRTLGFRQYIATAEANQLRFEEGEDIFSRYLPYAIVFHEAERWAKAFAVDRRRERGRRLGGGCVSGPALVRRARRLGLRLPDGLAELLRQLDRLRDGRGAGVVGLWRRVVLRRRLRRRRRRLLVTAEVEGCDSADDTSG